MNTLSDTDERKARPSVWPVYVMAVVIGAYSIWGLVAAADVIWPSVGLGKLTVVWAFIASVLMATDFPEVSPAVTEALCIWSGIHVLFGVVTVIGIVRLRPWGWWSALVWTVIWIEFAVRSNICEPAWGYGGLPYSVWLFPASALLIWLLATQRRLFFPPKPEHEE